jgi:probable F420-dependent oxidoreductase
VKFGLIYPQTEFPPDRAVVDDYIQLAETLGFSHIGAYDHVLGANPDRPGGWKGPYTHQDPFLEPFVLFSYMAARSRTLGFITAILVLPQRQTALAAKQAATLDVLCGGKLRVGIGNGWNEVEFGALGERFHNRGRRIEEQVAVIRRLWTEPLVDVKGRWHSIDDAGINPLPLQRPIPIWFGGHDDRVLQRAARLGDGWLPNFRSPEQAKEKLESLWTYLEQAGRSPKSFGLEARLGYEDGDPERWRHLIDGWREAGATHIALNTMRAGLATPADHMAAIRRFAETVMTP